MLIIFSELFREHVIHTFNCLLTNFPGLPLLVYVHESSLPISPSRLYMEVKCLGVCANSSYCHAANKLD